MGKILAVLVKKLAEGDFGAGPAKVYWALAGIKTYTAIAFAAAGLVLSQLSQHGLCAACDGYVASLLTVAGFLATIGLFDGAVRIEPPQKPYTLVR